MSRTCTTCKIAKPVEAFRFENKAKGRRKGRCPANAFVCPEQTGKTRCCATCAACWSTTKNVAFLEH